MEAWIDIRNAKTLPMCVEIDKERQNLGGAETAREVKGDKGVL